MFKVLRILVIAQTLGVCAVALSACGQKGPLVHPQDPLSADRATLLETLTPRLPNNVMPAPAKSPGQAPAPTPTQAPVQPSAQKP
jgi:predicted small lipoprotein YifL